MHMAMPIAATCSVALHLAALVLSQLLFGREADPSIVSRVLVLTVKVPQADQGLEGEPPFDDGAQRDAPSALVTEVAERTANLPSRTAAPEPEVRPPEAAPADALEDLAASGADVQADSAPQRAETSSAAFRETDQVERPGEELPGRPSRASNGSPAPESTPASPSLAPSPYHPGRSRCLTGSSGNGRRVTIGSRRGQRCRGNIRARSMSQGSRSCPRPHDLAIEQAIVEISTERDGRRLSTEMHMRRLAFSNYAQFVDRWDRNVEFHDDELDGRFHSNSEINLNNDRSTAPRFHGKVTTAAHSVNFGNSPGYVRRNRIFLGGLETGVGSIEFPARFVPFPTEAGMRERRVRYFDEDTRITFYADGSYGWHALGSGSDEQRAAISEDASYLIAAAKVELHVEGTVNGKALLYSPERIVIEGNLVYAQDPATTPDADDYLGLVSDKYIEIAPADVTGSGDLSIDAAIYAKRRFTVRGYGVSDGGLLSIHGSLAAGSLSATEPRYRTRIQFDSRFEKLRPPAFPMTDRYEVESWDGAWKVEPARSTQRHGS